MKQKLLTLLVALMGLAGTAWADSYNLYLCGTQVTSDNASDLSVIDGVSGTVSYNATSKTLTLQNATLSCATTYAIQSTIDGVTIAVVGANTVTNTKTYGIYMSGTGLTITGSGSLSVLSPRAAIRFKGTLAISGGVQLTAESTSYGNYACPIYAIGTGESSVVVSGAGTVVRLRGRDWPMHNVSSLTLNDGLQITAPEGAYLADDNYIRVGNTMVEDEWVVIMNPNLEQTVEGERVMNLSRYDVDGNGSVSIADVTLLVNALVGRVNYPATSLTLSKSSLSLMKYASIRLTTTILPADADLTALSWTTSNHLVATVDGGGYVTGRSAGTCTITARTLDGSNLSASCQLTVEEPDDNYEYVDLGLPSGTLWATMNIGASSPEDYGDYFAWGETTGYNGGKTTFNWSTYKYCNEDQTALTKYCSSINFGYNGFTDNLTELELTDDAAYVNWGSDWRMPSQEQFAELINSEYTTSEWTTLNGVNGRLITSIVPGYEGNSIFLPAAGYLYGASNFGERGSRADYWSRTLRTDYPADAKKLGFTSDAISSGSVGGRNYGRSVRPVRASQ